MATGFDLRHVCFEGRPAARHRPDRPASELHNRSLRVAHAAAGRPSPPTALSVGSSTGPGWMRASIGTGLSCGGSPHACGRCKVRSAEEARELLENRPDLLPVAVGSLLIGVTEFFRDPAVFEGCGRPVLPESGGPPRAAPHLDAGCSSGEELYSLAILLAEAGLLARQLPSGHRLPERGRPAGPLGAL